MAIYIDVNGEILEFPDGTPDSIIGETIRREFPPTGEDYYNLSMSDPAEALRTMGLPAYAQMRAHEATVPDPSVAEMAKGTAGTIWEGLKEYATTPGFGVLGQLQQAEAGMRAFGAGTGDLAAMVTDVIHPDTEDTYKQWLTENEQEDSDENRVTYVNRLADDFKVWQQQMEHQRRRKKIVEESPLPAATEAGSYIADPAMLLGGTGAAARLPRIAAGAAARGAGWAATKAGKAATRAGTIPERAAGAIAGEGAEAAVRKGTNITGGIGAGVMAAGQPLGAVAALPGALKAAGRGLEVAGDISTAAGKALREGGRLGMMERAAQLLPLKSAGRKIAEGLAVVDPLIALGGKTATGMGVGYGVGGTLGAFAGRKENQWPWEAWNSTEAIHGKGMGLALGGMGGLAFGGIDAVTKSGMRQKRVADVERHMGQLPEKYQALWRDYIEEQGIDNAATLLDIENIMRGELGEAKAIYTKEGADARGVTYGVDEAGNVTVKINLDKMDAAWTMGHEFGHVLRKAIQLEPQYDAVLQKITGVHVGDEVKVPGVISEAEIAARFNQYIKDLAVTHPHEAGQTVADYGGTAEKRARFVGEEIVSEHLAALIRGSGTDSMLRGFDTFTQRKLDNLLIRNSSNILGAMASRFTDIGLNPMDSISFKGLEKASPLVNALLRDLVRARKNLGEEMNLSEGRKSVVIDWKDLDAFGPELERFGLAEKDPATGKYVQKPREDMQAMEEASHKAVMDIIKDDDGAGVGVRKYTDENGNVVEILTGGKFSPEQMAAIGDSAAILPAVRENLKALINHMRDGDVINFDGLEATGRTRNRRTGKYRSTYKSSLKKSNRDAVIYALEVTKAGNITARAMNWSNVNTYARQLASKGKLGPWGNRPADFIADLRTYLENLSSTDPVRTRKLFADEKKAQILHDFVQGQRKGGSKFFRTYRLERMGNIQPTSERVKLSEEAIQLSKARFQPDSFTPEKLPGGEAFVHESGYNILQKGRGKFRVYKPDGELLGLRDTMKSASSLAGRNYRKGEARFMAAAEIDPLGMFSKAESAALELKQAKGSGQQMLAMLKKAGVKPEEMQYLGLDKFLKDKKSVTRDEIHDHIVQNQITVEETVLGQSREFAALKTEQDVLQQGFEREFGNDWFPEAMQDPRYARIQDELEIQRGQVTDPTKHPTQVEPGAVEGSYRELLLRLPEKTDRSGLPEGYSLVEGTGLKKWEVFGPGTSRYSSGQTKAEAIGSFWDMHGKAADYTGGHYGEYPNTLAHIRFQDRQSEKYGKVLDIQEIQSDWHQEGRKKGYQGGETVAEVQKLAHADREKFYSGKGKMSDAEWNALSERVKQWDEREAAAAGAVPDAPFKTSWHELAMKRMIKYAADNGYDAIAWTKGETQFSRYGSQEIAWVKDGDGWNVKATEQRGGEAGGIDIEGAARAEGILKEGGSRITSKEQLRALIKKTVMDRERGQWSPENFEKQVDKLTDRTWERMQNEDAGISLPRKEGMEGFYDRMLPKIKTWKKLGLKVEEGDVNPKGEFDPGQFEMITEEGDNISRPFTPETPAHIVRLSPEVKAKVVEEGVARFQPAAQEALEGRVVPGTPLAGTVVISPELAARFQPAVMDPGYQSPEGKVAFPMMADRMKVGTYKARSGKEFELRGGPDHPDLVDNKGLVAWAVEGGNTATKLQKAINETDGIALVTLQDEGAVSGNKDFRNIMLHELRHDQATNKKAARSLPRRIREAAAAIRKTAKKKRLKKQAAAPKGKKVAKSQWEDFRPKTLDELEATMVDMPFETRGDVLRKLASIDYKRKTGGIFWRDVMGDTIAYKNEDGYRTGDIVKVIQFDQGESIVNPKDVGTPEHPSYKFAVKGRSISNIKGRLSAFQVFRDAFETMGKEAPGRGVSPEGKVGASAYRSMMMRSMTDPIFREDVSGKTLDVKAYDEPLEFSGKTGPERAELQRRSEINRELGARFQPAEPLLGGTAWRNGAGYNVLQKGKRGKFRAYAPSGKLIGIYDQLKTAQKAAIRLQEKDATGKARFMPAGKKVAKDIELLLDKYDDGGHGIDTVEDVLVKLKDIIAEENVYEIDDAITALNRAIDDDWDSAGRGGFKEEGEQKFLDTLEAFVAKNKKPKKPTKGGKAEKAKDLREELIRKGEAAKQRRLEKESGADQARFMPAEDARSAIIKRYDGPTTIEAADVDGYVKFVEAKQDVLYEIDLPEGWEVNWDKSNNHTKWGTAYYSIKDPGGEFHKVRIGDHPASRAREGELGASEYRFELSKPATLESWSNAVGYIESWAKKKNDEWGFGPQ